MEKINLNEVTLDISFPLMWWQKFSKSKKEQSNQGNKSDSVMWGKYEKIKKKILN